MGQRQSKEELLYQQVTNGNIEGIKALHRKGASLEWIDKDGKTPLILACLGADYLPVAKTLIELGANINAYCPGRQAGTPLHHAARRSLDHTVKLLLSYGANALIVNDDCQTPLDVAREKGHINVVRAIESHICLFSGWLRELRGPRFLGALAPQLVSRKVWAIVLPCDSHNPGNPQKFELAIYLSPQNAQPRTSILLWQASIEDVNFNQSDPMLVIFDKSTKSHNRFLSENKGIKQQLQCFYNACRGIRQPSFPIPSIRAGAPSSGMEDVELAMAVSSSVQTAMEDNRPVLSTEPGSQGTNFNGWELHSVPKRPPKVVDNGWLDNSGSASTYNGWGPSDAGSSGSATQCCTPVGPPSINIPVPAPSAPPIPEVPYDDGPIHYPSIDDSPIDISMPDIETKPESSSKLGENSDASSSCVICLDAPKEGACVPCGHVVGCINCLNDVKAKNWGCPVCRAQINQVIKLYAV